MAKFVQRYEKNNYDSTLIRLPKGALEEIKSIAKSNGISVNKFIAMCIEKQTGLNLTLDKEAPWLKFKDSEKDNEA